MRNCDDAVERSDTVPAGELGRQERVVLADRGDGGADGWLS